MLFQMLGDSNGNPDPFSISSMLSYLVGCGFRVIVDANEYSIITFMSKLVLTFFYEHTQKKKS